MTTVTTRPPPLIHGLWCATLTPLTRAGGIDHTRFAAHVHALLAQGVNGVAPFGTTGEGQSFAADERRAGIDALLAAGVPGQRIVAGTGCAALPETIALSRHALAAGCLACLVLPPFFWKDATDDGLFAWYARLIEGVADARLKLLLYHLPQVSAVPLSVDLVARLAAAFPGTVVGVKDSEGNWDHTSALLARVPELTIVIGHEPHLPRLMRAGGAGTICGVANLYPDLVHALLRPTVSADDEKRIAAFIAIAFQQPFLAGFKSVLADRLHDPDWLAVRAPLLPLDETQRRSLRAALERAGFAVAASDAQP
jgi:4-hydroxy-tetrahydrodipicolinate synthase